MSIRKQSVNAILKFWIPDMSQELAINSYDIVSTLQALGMMKYWKGKHIILKKQVTCFIYRIRGRIIQNSCPTLGPGAPCFPSRCAAAAAAFHYVESAFWCLVLRPLLPPRSQSCAGRTAEIIRRCVFRVEIRIC